MHPLECQIAWARHILVPFPASGYVCDNLDLSIVVVVVVVVVVGSSIDLRHVSVVGPIPSRAVHDVSLREMGRGRLNILLQLMAAASLIAAISMEEDIFSIATAIATATATAASLTVPPSMFC